MTSGRLRCLCGISNRGDLTPITEGGVAGGTVLVGGVLSGLVPASIACGLRAR